MKQPALIFSKMVNKVFPRKRFHSAIDLCAHHDFGKVNAALNSVDFNGGELIFNWSTKHTTPDQLRIENTLSELCPSTANILHVGVGSSGFANRWQEKVAAIVGTTISPDEHRLAASLEIPNYSVQLLNKYSPAMRQLPQRFDYIIDNNPNLAPCCKYHFFGMWDSYRSLLNPGGFLMTDMAGLSWVLPGSDAHWKMDDRDLQWIADAFGFRVSRTGEDKQVRLLQRLEGL